jgi:hypothetical protein
MVPIASLWLPILLAAVLVFVASSVIHMVLKYHRNDFRALPDEAAVADALRPLSIPPGDYAMPYAGSTDAMKSPEYAAKLEKGPVAFMTVLPSGAWSMGSSLAQWFVYCVVVGVFAAYVTGRAVPAGGAYLDVFRFAGTTAFAGYALALAQHPIWYKRAWSTTLKSMFDGLVYALLTAGAFGWLWPSA